MRLLISVATALDARAAVAGGADIIDAKDPTLGALGAVAPSALRAILLAVASRRPVSAALGDIAAHDTGLGDIGAHATALGDIAAHATARGAAGDIDSAMARPDVAGLAFVKLGFASGLTGSAAAKRAASIVHLLPECDVVLAAYADVRDGLHRDDVVAIAAHAGARGVLLDTANKTGAGLFGVLDEDDIGRWIETGHAAGLTVALAGRLGAVELEKAEALGADVGGVRGAVCDGGREGRVRAAKVRALATARRETAPTLVSRAPARR